MTTSKLLMTTAIAGILCMATVPVTAAAEADTVSKPKGAIGMGTVAPGEIKSNQFWWPDQLD
ncbi:MAG: hypothetical protein KJN78_01060, partial [Gammaproteobacteria bacterium]|nr:hypothetical protein [Gammaproteobacteria bacterium]